MSHREHIAIIGTGASAVYLLKHLADEAGVGLRFIERVSLFEKSGTVGTGMPYSPLTTDRHNLANISSVEIPELPVAFADWLRSQDRTTRVHLGVTESVIHDGAIYTRLALGRYLQEQYRSIVGDLEKSGIRVTEHANYVVDDISPDAVPGKITLNPHSEDPDVFDRVIIATGHSWPPEDKPENGYYASPWPVLKLLPEEGGYHNHSIGTLGASLSAFDVVSSLAHRHGKFVEKKKKMTYQPHAGADPFKITMHSAEGLLPQLQFEQDKPLRRIYRHITREELLALVDGNGFLRLETYFDRVCRPVLGRAFDEDGLPEIATRLEDPAFRLANFVDAMTCSHEYADPFEGMRAELEEASVDVARHRTTHWKENLDDLIYTLNFHMELLPAEDHRFLTSVVLPFVMNVMAALPLASARMMLALHDAGSLEMLSGRVEVDDHQEKKGMTTLTLEDDAGKKKHLAYRMFIDCSGQKPVEMDQFPFPTLSAGGHLRAARVHFANPATEGSGDGIDDEKILREHDGIFYQTGGIDVDAAYRIIAASGHPHPRVHDIAFPHTQGVRPYSYGLQACSDTAAIVVKAILAERLTGAPPNGDMETATAIYREL